jgi:hypothetical protein
MPCVLDMQEHQHMYGALYALRILSNKYEFKDAEDRDPMQDVVNTTFPALLQIFQVRTITPDQDAW